MKPKYMLDTNICIYLMKHQPPQVRARFAECFVGDVVISAITLAELEFGVACSGEAQAHNQVLLDSLLEDILVAPFESQAARAYGPLRAVNRERNKDALGACRTWSAESENGTQRGQFSQDSQAHSPAMGQGDCEKWTAAAHLQPAISKSDRLLHKLIAAHALSLDVTLVTNNHADFKAYSGLNVENWVNSH